MNLIADFTFYSFAPGKEKFALLTKYITDSASFTSGITHCRLDFIELKPNRVHRKQNFPNQNHVRFIPIDQTIHTLYHCILRRKDGK